MANAIGWNCEIWITSEDNFEKFVDKWSLEGSSTLGRLGLEGLLDIRVLQLIH